MKLTIWLTGLSGSGKTTIANALFEKLNNFKCTVIDGDELRKERPNLGFSKEDRTSNIYHATYKAMTFLNYVGEIAIVSLISPYKEAREEAKKMLKTYSDSKFIEVYLNTPLNICQERDPKGLYKLVKEGKIKNFTGISSPYEIPDNPDIVIKPEYSIDNSIKIIYDYVLS